MWTLATTALHLAVMPCWPVQSLLLLLLPCVFPCQVGSAYLHLGLQPKDRVGVFGANCPEWMLAMQGCNRTRCDDSQHAL